MSLLVALHPYVFLSLVCGAGFLFGIVGGVLGTWLSRRSAPARVGKHAPGRRDTYTAVEEATFTDPGTRS